MGQIGFKTKEDANVVDLQAFILKKGTKMRQSPILVS